MGLRVCVRARVCACVRVCARAHRVRARTTVCGSRGAHGRAAHGRAAHGGCMGWAARSGARLWTYLVAHSSRMISAFTLSGAGVTPW
jgi:hypothetical protein